VRITISNDEGEVYAIATVTRAVQGAAVIVTDDGGDEVTLDTLVRDAAIWERQSKVADAIGGAS
jgi:hypothetical protein